QDQFRHFLKATQLELAWEVGVYLTPLKGGGPQLRQLSKPTQLGLFSPRSTVSDHIRNIQSIHFTTLENIDELNMRHKPLFHQKHNKIFVNVNQLNFMLHKPFR